MSLNAEMTTSPADQGQAELLSGNPKFVAVVNARAGEVLQRGQSSFKDEIADGFRKLGVSCDVRFVAPRQLAKAVEAALAERPDALLLAGGDGTVNRLLPQLVAADIPVGLLPLGTLNLLARDIGLEGTPGDIVPILAKLHARPVDLGEVNGTLFHSNAGLGFFARMAREREGARIMFPSSKMLGFYFAAMRSIWFHRPITIDITVDGVPVTRTADAVLITNNHFEGTPWRRRTLDTGTLEVHMLRTTGFVGRLRAAAAVVRGTWRELPHLESLTASTITVKRRGRSRSTMALDGEIHRVKNPITFRCRPGALDLIGSAAHEDVA